MSTTVEEIYTTTIRPLPESDRLEIASKILDEVTRKRRGAEVRERKGDISKFIGIFNTGDPNGADNDRIDEDLARAYADTHEDED